eukprot:scaffold206354_cov31-Prasinocladus_malaysianus.AAC.2
MTDRKLLRGLLNKKALRAENVYPVSPEEYPAHALATSDAYKQPEQALTIAAVAPSGGADVMTQLLRLSRALAAEPPFKPAMHNMASIAYCKMNKTNLCRDCDAWHTSSVRTRKGADVISQTKIWSLSLELFNCRHQAGPHPEGEAPKVRQPPERADAVARKVGIAPQMQLLELPQRGHSQKTRVTQLAA